MDTEVTYSVAVRFEEFSLSRRTRPAMNSLLRMAV